jgi:hypothetical protein
LAPSKRWFIANCAKNGQSGERDANGVGGWFASAVSEISLLIFGSFAHDPQGVLTAVYWLALVSIELCLDIGILELSVAPFAYADGRRVLLTIRSLRFV